MRYIIGVFIGFVVLFWMIDFDFVEEEQKPQPKEVSEEHLTDIKRVIKKILSPDANTSIKAHVLLSLGEDKNTTIETEIELNALLDNKEENYLYLWKEGDSIIGSGLKLRKSFPLGQHQLDFFLFDGDTLVAQDEVNVTAWRYLKKEYLYFNEVADEYMLSRSEFYNHLDQLLLVLTSYSKKSFIYAENNKVLEESFLYFEYSEHNYVITYTYDGDNLLSMERVNDGGYIIESHIYDEEGKEIIQQNYNEVVYDTYPDPYANYEENQKKNIVISDKEGHVIHTETSNGLYIKNYKYEKGKIVYREVIHPQGKNSASFQYNEAGQEIHREYKRFNKDGNTRSRDTVDTQYNEVGNMLRRERIYAIEENPVQHIVDKWTFEKGNIMIHEIEALVGVCPCTANIVKERTTYTYDKNGTRISSNHEYQREGDDAYKKSKESKVIISYTNVLE